MLGIEENFSSFKDYTWLGGCQHSHTSMLAAQHHKVAAGMHAGHFQLQVCRAEALQDLQRSRLAANSSNTAQSLRQAQQFSSLEL